jgi:hypothetical protein
MSSKLRAAKRASCSRRARATTLLLVIASTGFACSVYDESLRQGSALAPTAGAAAGGMAASAGTDSGGADASGGAGTSLGGELVDAGAPGLGGAELPHAGSSNAGSSNVGGSNGTSGAANAGAGGVVALEGSAGTSALAGSGGNGAGGGGSGAGGGTTGVGGESSAGAAGTELVVGKSTTASTQQPANPSASGNDGQSTTRWSATTAALPQWWRVDLGASHALTQVAVQFEFPDRKYTYAVETSNDDSSYSVQANVVDGIGAVQTILIPSHASARYVRITCTATVPGIDPSTGASRPTWASFWEVSVLGI